MGARLEQAIGVLNGAVGDYLARTGNGLATRMELVHEGEPLPLTRAALERACPHASGRVVVLLHGLMCTEHIFALEGDDDYGARLARDLGLTPLYVRYNSGLAIDENAALLAGLLEALAAAYPAPLEEIVLLGFSMGGLVARRACAVGGPWLPLVRRVIYLATPHGGAPLERLWRRVAAVLGRVGDPYARLVAEAGHLRSQGVKDLGDRDQSPLAPAIRHYLVAAGRDVMVPPICCTDVELPPDHVRILPGVGHLSLAHHPEAYASILEWCKEVS